VNIHFYDLSGGVAKAVSPCLLGKPLEGLWHTGVVVYGKEYFFGGEIFYDKPGQTAFGKPTKMLRIGWTLQRQAELHDFIVEDLRPMFNREVYDVMQRNCNHFTDVVVLWLTGRRLPVEVANQPEHIMQLPMAKLMRPLLNRWLGNIDGAKTAASRAEEGSESLYGVVTSAARPPWRQVAVKDIAAVRLRARGMNIFTTNSDIIGCDNQAMEDHWRFSQTDVQRAGLVCDADGAESWQVPGSMVTVLPADGWGTGIWGIVCAGGSGFDGGVGEPEDGCWVRWLDVSTPGLAVSSRARLCTEFVPKARLAPARAVIASKCSSLYLAALRAMLSTAEVSIDDQVASIESASSAPSGGLSSRRGASCGWRPTMASLPRCMQAPAAGGSTEERAAVSREVHV